MTSKPVPKPLRDEEPRAPDDADALRGALVQRVSHATGKDPGAVAPHDWLFALAQVTRDRLVERWIETSRAEARAGAKRVYYLSMEFLLGRALSNGLLALGLEGPAREALLSLGLDPDEVAAREPDPGLGNGGLGRLAACFLDSMATLGLPAIGYGIRFEFGMFAQRIFDGRQIEQPDLWLANGNPWEFPRPEIAYRVQFGGTVVRRADGLAEWVGTDDLRAVAYDTLVPGYGRRTVNVLRLWSAKAMRDLDMPLFNAGHHHRAAEDKVRSETVSRVLYPDDSTAEGHELRLRQEHFFVSASLQDILARYLRDHDGLTGLPQKVAIHLNDTHPALAVPELMRLLVDEHGVGWTEAWAITQRVFSYTNHTLMPEALETWPVELMGRLLPRHLEIVYEINERFLTFVRQVRGHDIALLRRLSLIDETGGRRVRMGHLSVVASHKVNGVSKLHSDLVRTHLFADFADLYPDRFCNQTNGISPRRWLAGANPGLSAIIDDGIGPRWRRDLDRLEALGPLAGDAAFREAFARVKRANKERLAALIQRDTGIVVDPGSIFDVQVKRIHEYKRQLLNVLRVVERWQAIAAAPHAGWTPRTVLFAGKAAPGYVAAKLIIKLIHDVGRWVNADPVTSPFLKVVFVPNYGVSAAETIIPGADLSEQISTAGTEASGTGNMKLALNGALTIGTDDGATIEIKERVGLANIFIFGHDAAGIERLKQDGYDPRAIYESDPGLRGALDALAAGQFNPEEPDRFRPLVDALLAGGDRYCLLADFAAYRAAQAAVDRAYADADVWTAMAVRNVAGMGPFSSDRTIAGYAADIWGVQPLPDA